MAKRMILMLAVMVAILFGLFSFKKHQMAAGAEEGKKHAPGPAAVSTLVVKSQIWEPVIRSVGSLRAVHGVTVSTDMAGIVSQISFESGSKVKKGDLLMQMDTQQEEAQLRNAEARLVLAQQDIERKRDLLTKKAIATSDLDTADSELRRAGAAVEESKAVIARKHIMAPFDGVIGIRQVDLGMYVNPGAMIAPLQSLDPIYVEFALPQQNIGTVQIGKKVRVVVDGVEGSFEGEVTAVDSLVDMSTRNITIQATVPNPEMKLRPGMFANVEVVLPQQNEIIAVPNSAISFAPYGDSVFVVRKATAPESPSPTEVAQQFVKLGTTRGDQVAILSGLKPGDEIVTSAVFRLRPGAPVKVNNNSPQPSNDLKPTPANT